MPAPRFHYFSNRYGFYAYPDDYMGLRMRKNLEEGRVYEPRTIDFIRENCGTGDVVTGGAYIGDFLPGVSRGLAEGALVHSFEPNPVSYAAAAATLELNGLTNVRLHPKALGEEAGTAALKLYNDKRGGELAGGTARIDTGLEDGAITEDTHIEVDMVTLDSLVPEDRHVSILHFDLEGFEEQGLKGAVGTITRCKPILILETKKYEAEWLNGILPGCNYVKGSFYEGNQFYIHLP